MTSRGTKRKATEDDDDDHKEKKYKTELLDERTTKDKVFRGKLFGVIIEFADIKDMCRWIGVDKQFSVKITTNYAQHWKRLAGIGINATFKREWFRNLRWVFIEETETKLCRACRQPVSAIFVNVDVDDDGACHTCRRRDDRLFKLERQFSIRLARGYAMHILE